MRSWPSSRRAPGPSGPPASIAGHVLQVRDGARHPHGDRVLHVLHHGVRLRRRAVLAARGVDDAPHGVGAVVVILAGKATVLYTFYPPLKAHRLFYIGLTLVVVGSWGWSVVMLRATHLWRAQHPQERVVQGVAREFGKIDRAQDALKLDHDAPPRPRQRPAALSLECKNQGYCARRGECPIGRLRTRTSRTRSHSPADSSALTGEFSPPLDQRRFEARSILANALRLSFLPRMKRAGPIRRSRPWRVSHAAHARAAKDVINRASDGGGCHV
jgi:Cytochrome C and Quinol oxidase polypeptide I